MFTKEKPIHIVAIALLLIAVQVIVFADYFNIPKQKTPNENSIVCTQEAKQCPDGSYVSRTGPNCEFEECAKPSIAQIDMSDWKTYRNEEYGFEVRYPTYLSVFDIDYTDQEALKKNYITPEQVTFFLSRGLVFHQSFHWVSSESATYNPYELGIVHLEEDKSFENWERQWKEEMQATYESLEMETDIIIQRRSAKKILFQKTFDENILGNDQHIDAVYIINDWPAVFVIKYWGLLDENEITKLAELYYGPKDVVLSHDYNSASLEWNKYRLRHREEFDQILSTFKFIE